MSETIKGFIIAFVVFILWSIGCFVAGILYNTRTNGNIDNGDTEYQREQQELDEQIAVTTTTISGITNDIQQQIYISTRAVGNLQELLQEIRKQRIDL
jgi:hypothetical protein